MLTMIENNTDEPEDIILTGQSSETLTTFDNRIQLNSRLQGPTTPERVHFFDIIRKRLRLFYWKARFAPRPTKHKRHQTDGPTKLRNDIVIFCEPLKPLHLIPAKNVPYVLTNRWAVEERYQHEFGCKLLAFIWTHKRNVKFSPASHASLNHGPGKSIAREILNFDISAVTSHMVVYGMKHFLMIYDRRHPQSATTMK